MKNLDVKYNGEMSEIDKIKARQESIMIEIGRLQEINASFREMINTIIPVEEGTVQTIPTYELAEMMEKKHSDVLRMLDGSEKPKVIGIKQVISENVELRFQDYFIESTYKVEGNNCSNSNRNVKFRNRNSKNERPSGN